MIKELLVSEGDTVTVGQGIAKLEAVEGGGGGAKETSTPEKESPPAEQRTQTEPEPKKEESKEEPKKEPPPPPMEEKKPAPPSPSEPKKDDKKPEAPAFGAGSRAENRVCCSKVVKNITPTIFQVKMNRMRLRIAERLKQSQNTAASLTTFNEVDMSSIMEFRKLYKDDILKKTGVKLGFMSAFARASILVMKEIPSVNASIEGPNGGDTIVYRDYVDISVAVATPKGLVTPVVRNAESMDMIGVEQAIADLGKKVWFYLYSP